MPRWLFASRLLVWETAVLPLSVYKKSNQTWERKNGRIYHRRPLAEIANLGYSNIVSGTIYLWLSDMIKPYILHSNQQVTIRHITGLESITQEKGSCP